MVPEHVGLGVADLERVSALVDAVVLELPGALEAAVHDLAVPREGLALVETRPARLTPEEGRLRGPKVVRRDRVIRGAWTLHKKNMQAMLEYYNYDYFSKVELLFVTIVFFSFLIDWPYNLSSANYCQH